MSLSSPNSNSSNSINNSSSHVRDSIKNVSFQEQIHLSTSTLEHHHKTINIHATSTNTLHDRNEDDGGMNERQFLKITRRYTEGCDTLNVTNNTTTTKPCNSNDTIIPEEYLNPPSYCNINTSIGLNMNEFTKNEIEKEMIAVELQEQLQPHMRSSFSGGTSSTTSYYYNKANNDALLLHHHQQQPSLEQNNQQPTTNTFNRLSNNTSDIITIGEGVCSEESDINNCYNNNNNSSSSNSKLLDSFKYNYQQVYKINNNSKYYLLAPYLKSYINNPLLEQEESINPSFSFHSTTYNNTTTTSSNSKIINKRSNQYIDNVANNIMILDENPYVSICHINKAIDVLLHSPVLIRYELAKSRERRDRIESRLIYI